MSPNTANSLVHDLVEMAKAMDVLPQVEQERDSLKAEVDRLSQSVQDRELRIVDYKSKVDELLARVRATEAERDDAELRFLELDEKAHKVLGLLKGISDYASSAEVVIDPPKPQPEPVVEVPNPVLHIHAGHGYDALPQGSSEVPPTSASNPSAGLAASGQPASQSATGAESVTTENASPQLDEAPKPSGPYTGRLYHDYPTYVSRWDWIAGGGTDESYNWHPAWA